MNAERHADAPMDFTRFTDTGAPSERKVRDVVGAASRAVFAVTGHQVPMSGTIEPGFEGEPDTVVLQHPHSPEVKAAVMDGVKKLFSETKANA